MPEQNGYASRVPKFGPNPGPRKRRLLVRSLLRGSSAAQAVRDAGYSEGTAEGHAYAIVRRPEVQSELTEAMRRAGLTPDALARTVREALGATLVEAGQDTGLPDHKVRLAAYDRCERAYGWAGVREQEQGQGGNASPAVAITVQFVQAGPGGGVALPHDEQTSSLPAPMIQVEHDASNRG